MKLILSKLDYKLRKRIEAQIAEDDRARLGGLQAQVTQQKTERALVRKSEGCQTRSRSLAPNSPLLRIALISFRRRELDRDNLIGGFKPLRDAIARWLNLDDSDRVIEWEYGQQKTSGLEGTAVRIERI